MSKTRVYEVASQVGLPNRELLTKIASLGIQVRNHMSSLESGDVERIKRAIDKERQQNVVEERIRPTVVRRRIVGRAEPETKPKPKPTAEPKVAKKRVAKPKPQPEAEPVAAKERPAVQGKPKPEIVEPPPAPKAEPVEKKEEPKVKEAKPVPPKPVEEMPIAVQPPPPSPSSVTPLTQPEPIPEPVQVVPLQPLSYEERLGNKSLPPGVVARGKQVSRGAAPLSPEERSRIVLQHAEQKRTVEPSVTTTPPPRRRELARSAIGPTGRQQTRTARPGRARKTAPGKKAQKTELTTPSAQKRVIRIEDQIGLQTLAQRMSLKATEVLMKLMQLGMTGVMINSTLDADTAKIVASEFGFEVENVAVSYDDFISEARGSYIDEESDRMIRPPVVTVMGHVDHGKTTLLDKIRKSNVAAREAGGITQHLGAYRVDTKRGTLVFLDTPGHAAFTAMRARGAQITDIVILVVAADDGVMPQTREAINHSKAANVPIVVAVNKIDKEDARPEVVMRDLANEGLQAEQWGGDIMLFNVSATTGEGIDDLLEGVLLQAEMLELKTNPNIPATGVVLEAYVDKGRGPVSNMLIGNGTLKIGDFVVAGSTFGKVRAMVDDRGKQTSKAGASTPVEVLGLGEIPDVGESFDVVTDAKVAQQLADRRKGPIGVTAPISPTKAGIEDLLQKMQEGEADELKLVVKADVQGSAEALVKALTELTTDKVKVSVIHSGAGAITENDVMLASASKAMVVGFHVRPTGGAIKVSKSEGVEIRLQRVIYDVIDDVKSVMGGLLKPELVEKALGKAEVRKVFSLPRGKIAGCYVSDGKILRSGKVRLVRDSVQIWEGSIKSLRRVKDDVREVASGLECGVGLENYSDIKENDIIECFEIEEVRATI